MNIMFSGLYFCSEGTPPAEAWYLTDVALQIRFIRINSVDIMFDDPYFFRDYTIG